MQETYFNTAYPWNYYKYNGGDMGMNFPNGFPGFPKTPMDF